MNRKKNAYNEDSKVDIETEKVDIHDKKVDIESVLYEKGIYYWRE